jgi:hypothetical protein
MHVTDDVDEVVRIIEQAEHARDHGIRPAVVPEASHRDARPVES